jgi:hypothetical protein
MQRDIRSKAYRFELKRDTTLVSATTENGYELAVYDDGDGPLWLYGQEFGCSMVIRARSFEQAWGIMLDESFTIEDSEVWEAYGYNSEEEYAAVCDRIMAEEADGVYPEWPGLAEGYEYQSNFTGTGIVDVGHYSWLREAELVDFKTSERGHIKLTIRHHDHATEAA